MHDIVVSIKELLSDPLVFSVVMTVLAPAILPRLAKALETISDVILRRKAALTAGQINLIKDLSAIAVLSIEKRWAKVSPEKRDDGARLEAAVVELNALLLPYGVSIDATSARAFIHAALILAEVNGQLPAAPEPVA